MGVGFIAKMVAIIVKSAVNSKVGSELGKKLIGASIDGVSERSITEIYNFINGKKSKLEHILSEENMKEIYVAEENIDFVIAELKHLLSKVKITDELIRVCRYNPKDLKGFLWSEYPDNKNLIENESDIEKGLNAVAETLIELVREGEEFEKDLIIHISNTVDDIQLEIKDDSSNMMKRFDRLEKGNQAILDKVSENSSTLNKDKAQRKIESRTKEYADKWDANMFLNDFDKRDENAGVNVKLSEVYLDEHLPHYIWYKNTENNPSSDLKELLSDYINEKRDSKMLLILGQPGIGKSTLITWITANFSDKVDSILVYQFANTLNNINWSKANLFDEILNTLSLSLNDLEGKTLIFDGFDEINAGENRRAVLDKIYEDLIYRKNLKKFSLIITCRENYIKELKLLKCKYITLQPWDESQIKSFCHIFHEKVRNKMYDFIIEKAVEIKDVFGIPLILYMVLALNISIEKEASIVDVYDKIFSLEGGIYDRCIDNKKFASSHRIGEVKKQIHQISRDIAMWMFENEPDEARIPQEEYQIICINVMQANEQEDQDITQDFKIGGYFKLVHHCEGIETEELDFVHRTIYEYFVVETIFTSMYEALDISKERMAYVFGKMLKRGTLSINIINYLRHKIICSKLNNAFSIVNESFQLMLQDGMTYYTGECYKNVIECEMNVFANMLEMIHLWENSKLYKCDNEIDRYIRFNKCSGLNLERTNLEKANLRGANLEKANLEKANLRGANLQKANLEGANLRGANLEGADLRKAYLRKAYLRKASLRKAYLRKADLRGVDLRGVDLSEAFLRGVDLRGVDLRGVDLRGVDLSEAFLRGAIFDEKQIAYLENKCNLYDTRVYIEEMDEIISYGEYCERKS